MATRRLTTPRRGFVALLLWTAAVAAQDGRTNTPSVLFVSSYSGKLTTLALPSRGGEAQQVGGKTQAGNCSGAQALEDNGRAAGAVAELRTVSQLELGGAQSFLALDAQRCLLFSVDEGFQSEKGNGTLFALQVQNDGSLQQVGKQETEKGPVFMEFFGGGNMAIPHFGGQSVSVFNVADAANLVQVQRETFALDKPGPKEQQNEAKPHQAVLDPTGKFIVSPDLGADLLRVFAVGGGNANQVLTPLQPVQVKAGSGPRHAAMVDAGGRTFMYVVTELSSEILGFGVDYSGGGMKLQPLFTMKVHGQDASQTAEFAAASEIAVSPDKRFLVVASRNESSLSMANLDAGNSTAVASDPLSNYRIDAQTGSLEAVQIKVPSGGRFPRQFSMSKDGSLVAVANQKDGRVVLIERDVQSGRLGSFVGHARVEGEVTSVIFAE